MSTKTARILSTTLNLLVILSMLLVGRFAPKLAQAYTDTGQEDYAPGSEVTIWGDNRNFEAPLGYQVGETIKVTVIQPVLPDPLTCEGVVDANGYWECKLWLSTDPALAVGYYEYQTLGLTSGTSETHFFTDAAPPSIEQLWQCDPPALFNPRHTPA